MLSRLSHGYVTLTFKLNYLQIIPEIARDSDCNIVNKFRPKRGELIDSFKT